MERDSPQPCPPTVTVRRNPPRKARATPSSAIPLREPVSSPSLSRDIFSSELYQNHDSSNIISADPSPRALSESLKVYLRIRPPKIQKNYKNITESKNAWPKSTKIKSNSRPKPKSDEICVQVNVDLCSVTVSTPQALQETKRTKSEVYGGFSRVFASEASQSDVYNEMVRPLVEDFLNGKSGMLAAMGPSGSGKTHTVFGCVRDPGMVPLALRHIFSDKENIQTELSRVFYLSMFEISSEGGKAERLLDLLHEGGDVHMQSSVLKGLQEAMVCDAQQAESLIAKGMLKRATATTNSNFQSSRSQCVINIRCSSKDGDEEVAKKGRHAILTIVDLAGAEREKKTGNRGARLQESNFINNTSMVFGLCLRALLDHQKNRNKLLQKHYKNSLLTRYMQDYMEGKKRMMLILTVKPGVDDYLDTSFLLRQASPFTKIKFQTVEETINLTSHKRPNQAMPQAEQLKKMKFRNGEASLIEEGKVDRDFQSNRHTEIPGKAVKDGLNQNIKHIDVKNSYEIHVPSGGLVGLGNQGKPSINDDQDKYAAGTNREYKIMLGLSKALWIILKQYKKKLEGLEIENGQLRDQLSNEKTRNLHLENELKSEKMRALALENPYPDTMHDASSNRTPCQETELQKVNLEVSSYSSEQTLNVKESDSSSTDSNEAVASCSGEAEEPCHQAISPKAKTNQSFLIDQLLEDLPESVNNAQAVEEIKHTCATDVYSISQELPTATDNAEVLHCFENIGRACMSPRNQETVELTSACPLSSHVSEQDLGNNVGDSKSLEPKSGSVTNGSCLDISPEFGNNAQDAEEVKQACAVDVNARNKKLSTTTNGAEGLHCFEGTGEVCTSSRSQETIQLTSACPHLCQKSGQDVVNIGEDPNSLESRSGPVSDGSSNDVSLEFGNNARDAEEIKHAHAVGVYARNQNLSTTTDGAEVLHCFEDTVGACTTSSRSQETIQLANTCPELSHKSDQDVANVVGDPKTSETDVEFTTSGSCLNISVECGNKAQHVKEHSKSQELSTSIDDDAVLPSRSKETIPMTSACLHSTYKSAQDAENILRDPKSLEPEDAEIPKGARSEPAQVEDSATVGSTSTVMGQIVSVSLSHAVINSSESSGKEEESPNMDEEKHNSKEGKEFPELPMVVIPQEERGAGAVSNNSPKLTVEKPKRRLLPASSVLLKDISILNIKDESEIPKGTTKGGKRAPMDDNKNRTRGSLSLLNLLTSKLNR